MVRTEAKALTTNSKKTGADQFLVRTWRDLSTFLMMKFRKKDINGDQKNLTNESS